MDDLVDFAEIYPCGTTELPDSSEYPLFRGIVGGQNFGGVKRAVSGLDDNVGERTPDICPDPRQVGTAASGPCASPPCL